MCLNVIQMKVFKIILLFVILNFSVTAAQTQSIKEQEAEIETNLQELLTGFEKLQEIIDKLDQDKKSGAISIEEINKRKAEISVLENKLIALDKSVTAKKENLEKIKESSLAEISTTPEEKEFEDSAESVAVEKMSKVNDVASVPVKKNIQKESAKPKPQTRILRSHKKMKKEVVQLINKIKLNHRIISISKEDLNKKKADIKKAIDQGEASSKIFKMNADVKKTERWLEKIESENNALKQKLKEVK